MRTGKDETPAVGRNVQPGQHGRFVPDKAAGSQG